ncbi:MAG TPA: imidazolonepropionase, partial [Ignavibacteriales bacterium]|nr:imidazolonepropionase [Ignavibacteriales bacterium]
YKRGKELGEIGVLEDHSILVEKGIIKDIVPSSSINGKYEIIDLSGKVILPGLVECHTHTAFAGSRANEFRKKIEGATYEEIAYSGGGINATVRAVRKHSLEELVDIMKPRVVYFIEQGITTLEIKSGYGLSLDDELKLLQAVKKISGMFPIDIIPTFLGAHTVPPEFKNSREEYITLIIDKMLPEIAGQNLATFCDAFCEKTAFSAEETDRIFAKAAQLGMKIKLHTEQFNNIGGLEIALKYKAVSADHLEVIKDEDIDKFSGSETAAVLLPGVSFFLNYGFAPARKLIEKNAIVALSTDYNPGSSHIANLNLIMGLAAIKMKMKVEEVISAVTINAAKALDVSGSTGSLEIGKKADFAVFDAQDFSDIVYNVGKNLNIMTVKNGNIIYSK